MRNLISQKLDSLFLFGIIFLVALSLLVLRSISGDLFPTYYLYVFLGFLALLFFSKIDFSVLSVFSKHLYVLSIVFLVLPLIIGQVTRGAVRWIPLGALTIQPSEIVRPFILVFFANYFTAQRLDFKRLLRGVLLFLLPFGLIIVQPSLGVAVLTAVGFFGILLAADFPKKYLALALVVLVALLPLIWGVLAPYQRLRVVSFIDPAKDPLGAGYNSIQSMISVGSGQLIGRGLGEGVQTQLAFLPEKHTDFIFAAISEELGFLGATLLLIGLFFVLWKVAKIIESAETATARAFISGLFLMLFAQVIVHVAMNMGMLPITGVPLPLVSAGGSSLIATMTALGIAVGAKRA